MGENFLDVIGSIIGLVINILSTKLRGLRLYFQHIHLGNLKNLINPSSDYFPCLLLRMYYNDNNNNSNINNNNNNYYYYQCAITTDHEVVGSIPGTSTILNVD